MHVNQAAAANSRPSEPEAAGIFVGAATFAAILVAFWFAASYFSLEARIGGGLPSAFASFALLFAPFWFFGFGLAPALARRLKSRAARILFPGLLLIPYLIFSLPRGEFRAGYAVTLFAIPIGLAALLDPGCPVQARFWLGRGFSRDAKAGESQNNALRVRDILALLAVALPVEFGWLRAAWPHPGLGSLPKLLLVDAVLYAFLVVRPLEGVGYDFRVRLRDLAIGLREWAIFAPFGIGLGLALHFIHFRGWAVSGWNFAAGWLVTFFFVAVPEELFFRGLLQNMLEPHLGRRGALAVAAPIFGLSHFNKPLPFNWRYVLLATIAGVFYGRAWRNRRRISCSAITHATVDVVWGLWFR